MCFHALQTKVDAYFWVSFKNKKTSAAAGSAALQWIFEAFASVVLIRVWAVIRRAAVKLRGLAECRFINESTRKQPAPLQLRASCYSARFPPPPPPPREFERATLRRPAGSADESTETRPLSDGSSFFSLWLLCQNRTMTPFILLF